MLTQLDNKIIFNIAFRDKIVFTAFVKDILGIEIEVDKIETEKKFEPKVGNIDFSYDIFAESTDHRVIIEIQKVDYDYHFDRFLHYHLMAIGELQRSAKGYHMDHTVYTIVILTAPYRIDDQSHLPIKDEVLISSVDPRNLQDKVVHLYGHKLIFLNHHYRNENTPANYRDWLDLIYESIHNPDSYKVNLENSGIRRAVEIIDYDNLSPATRHEMKIEEDRRVVSKLNEEDWEKKGHIEGKKEGFEEATLKIARQMKQANYDPEAIAQITGLVKEEIEKL